jgi:pimeloyl-ACP methyl ester carboxylesterase
MRPPISTAFSSLLAIALAVCGVVSVRAAQPWVTDATVAVKATRVAFTLRGTLYVPASSRKVPAVVAFHGASEPLASTALYKHLAEGLPQLGVAVLLFDRRGSGASTGTNNVSYETLADDGIAGARAVRKVAAIDPARVGYWGVSQGGWLATLAAIRDRSAAFAVAVSAPLVTPEAQMEFAMSNRLHALGYSAADVAAMMRARKAWGGFLRGTNARAAAVTAIEAIEKRPWFDLMYMPTSASLTHDPAKSSWREHMDDDPMKWIQRVRIPMLFILGAQDPWIPVAASAARLHDVSRTHPSIRYVVVPNANHLMMLPPQHETMNDAEPAQIATERPDSPAYFMILGAWLERTLHLTLPHN